MQPLRTTPLRMMEARYLGPSGFGRSAKKCEVRRMQEKFSRGPGATPPTGPTSELRVQPRRQRQPARALRVVEDFDVCDARVLDFLVTHAPAGVEVLLVVG